MTSVSQDSTSQKPPTPRRPVKVVFVDIDGTLLPDGHDAVPDRIRRAIEGARARGIKVVLCSGRSVAGVLPIGEQLHMTKGDFFIASHGAITGEFTGSRRRPFMLVGQPRTFDPKAAFVVAMAACPDVKMAIEEPGKGWWVNTAFDPERLNGQQHRVRNEKRLWDTPVTRAVVHAEGIAQVLPQIVGTGVNAYAAAADFVDVVGPKVTKAPAAEALRMAWGLPHQDTAAIGDGLNDVAILDQVRHAAAMDHAPDAVKDVADVIVPPLDQHGAAVFFDSLTVSTRPLTGEPLPTRPRTGTR